MTSVIQRVSAFLRRYAGALVIFLGICATWEWAIPVLGIPAFILPPLSRVAQAAAEPESRLLFHTAVTAGVAVAGFALGSVLAIALAVLFIHSRSLENALYPWVLMTQTMPLVALAPLLIFWFGQGIWPRIVLAALFAFFPMLVNTLRGLRDFRPEQLELLKIYAASHWQILLRLRLPSSLPAMFAGLKIAGALAVIGALSAELAGANAGLGFAITVAASRLQTARTFAAILAAALLGLLLNSLLALWERWTIGGRG